MSFIWTPEKTEQAKALYLGGMSATEVAIEIGAASRSAVLGKLFRIGAVKSSTEAGREAIRVKAAQRARVQAQNDARRREKQRQEELKRIEREQRQAERMILLSDQKSQWKDIDMSNRVECSPRIWSERKFGECAYPVEGDGADVKSCCNAVRDGSNYCPGHSKIMFTATEKREVKIPRGGLDFRRAKKRDEEAELFFAA